MVRDLAREANTTFDDRREVLTGGFDAGAGASPEL
jgi:transcription termination factor Rho